VGLTVTVLGSSGTCSGADNDCSGLLVRSATTTVMLDTGPGTFSNLQRHVDPSQLDAVLVTHSHPDHWLDLPMIRNALRYVFRLDGVPLYTTRQTLDFADEVSSEDGLGSTFEPHVLSDGSEFRVGDLSVRCSRTDHPVETLAMRIDHEDRSFAYTSDTGPGWSLAQLGEGIDLAFSEATYLEGSDDATPVHLSARQAGALAREAGVGRLVITHVLPSGSPGAAAAEAADAYGAPVEVAELHRTFDV
jgi:ribonuclease BN (tRNA processing enzyme)